MKQYFTGFFTAMSIVISIFLFIGASSNKKKIEADAIITNKKKLPIAVLTADCVPILLYDNNNNMIAAIHAGWKGAYKGIIKKVINFMIKQGLIIEIYTRSTNSCFWI